MLGCLLGSDALVFCFVSESCKPPVVGVVGRLWQVVPVNEICSSKQRDNGNLMPLQVYQNSFKMGLFLFL